jgi:hypothetical protein
MTAEHVAQVSVLGSVSNGSSIPIGARHAGHGM